MATEFTVLAAELTSTLNDDATGTDVVFRAISYVITRSVGDVFSTTLEL